jgi:hypothetical protein
MIADTESWHPDPNACNPGTLCVSARGSEVRTWGLCTIDRAEMVIRDCPSALLAEAKALLWDLAGWVVSSNHRLEHGEEISCGEGCVRFSAGEEGLELWELDATRGAFVPGVGGLLAQLAPLAAVATGPRR